MKNILKLAIGFLSTLVLFTSCEKVIDIDLKDADKKYVVEAEINDQPGPYFVKVSRTVSFSEKNQFPAVQGAQVTISDNAGTLDTLIEVQPGLYRTQSIQGVSGRTYTLNINASGNIISAVSTMPAKVMLDSVTFLVSTFGQQPGETPNFIPIPRFQDPPSFDNTYRFKRTINSKLDNTFFIDNDNLINGLQYQRPLFGGELDIKKGDTVHFELQCIDRAIYDYFNSLNASIGSGPGGGATPANPITNMKGALGYFSAHTSDSKKVVAEN